MCQIFFIWVIWTTGTNETLISRNRYVHVWPHCDVRVTDILYKNCPVKSYKFLAFVQPYTILAETRAKGTLMKYALVVVEPLNSSLQLVFSFFYKLTTICHS